MTTRPLQNSFLQAWPCFLRTRCLPGSRSVQMSRLPFASSQGRTTQTFSLSCGKEAVDSCECVVCRLDVHSVDSRESRNHNILSRGCGMVWDRPAGSASGETDHMAKSWGIRRVGSGMALTCYRDSYDLILLSETVKSVYVLNDINSAIQSSPERLFLIIIKNSVSSGFEPAFAYLELLVSRIRIPTNISSFHCLLLHSFSTQWFFILIMSQ